MKKGRLNRPFQPASLRMWRLLVELRERTNLPNGVGFFEAESYELSAN